MVAYWPKSRVCHFFIYKAKIIKVACFLGCSVSDSNMSKSNSDANTTYHWTKLYFTILQLGFICKYVAPSVGSCIDFSVLLFSVTLSQARAKLPAAHSLLTRTQTLWRNPNSRPEDQWRVWEVPSADRAPWVSLSASQYTFERLVCENVRQKFNKQI